MSVYEEEEEEEEVPTFAGSGGQCITEDTFVLDVNPIQPRPFTRDNAKAWTEEQHQHIKEDIKTRSPRTVEELKQMVCTLWITTFVKLNANLSVKLGVQFVDGVRTERFIEIARELIEG